MGMSISVQTKLDYDRSVGTEDRFAIRKAMDAFVNMVNHGNKEAYGPMISDGALIEGFSDIPYVKQGFVAMLSRRFKGDGLWLMRFPELKLSFSRYLFQLAGTYEEYADGILVTEGTITISLIKNTTEYQFVRIIFYPRMMLKNENE